MGGKRSGCKSQSSAKCGAVALGLPGCGSMTEHWHMNCGTQGRTPTFSMGHSEQAMSRLAFYIPATVVCGNVGTFPCIRGSPTDVDGETLGDGEEAI